MERRGCPRSFATAALALASSAALILSSCPNPSIDALAKAKLVLRQGATAIEAGDPFDFGTATVGDSRQFTFTVSNAGTIDLELTGADLVLIGGANAGQFSVASQPATVVRPGESTSFVLAFEPSASGLKTGTVTIATNG